MTWTSRTFGWSEEPCFECVVGNGLILRIEPVVAVAEPEIRASRHRVPVDPERGVRVQAWADLQDGKGKKN